MDLSAEFKDNLKIKVKKGYGTLVQFAKKLLQQLKRLLRRRSMLLMNWRMVSWGITELLNILKCSLVPEDGHEHNVPEVF